MIGQLTRCSPRARGERNDLSPARSGGDVVDLELLLEPAERRLAGVLVEAEGDAPVTERQRAGDRERIEPVPQEPGFVLANLHDPSFHSRARPHVLGNCVTSASQARIREAEL